MVDSLDITGAGITGNEQLTRIQGFRAGPSSLGSVQRSYLKFDLSDIPVDAVITSAVLRVWLEEINGGGFNTVDPHSSLHYIEDDNWDEGSVNWENMPGHEPGYIDDELLVVTPGYQEWNLLSNSGTAHWDYTEDLGEEDNLLSLMLMTPHEDYNTYAGFQTSEGNMKPEITVKYEIIPEPATLCLLGLGGLLLLRRK